MPTDPKQLGHLLRQARQRAGLTLEELAGRTGMSLRFLSELERGKDGASLGRVLQVAAALGVELRPQSGANPLIEIDRYPELKMLGWQRAGQRFIDERDALALYEANWRFVDTGHLIPREAALIRQLTARHGRGVLNV
jgi:transcriptional regulator with XRE-family HTH domain